MLSTASPLPNKRRQEPEQVQGLDAKNRNHHVQNTPRTRVCTNNDLDLLVHTRTEREPLLTFRPNPLISK